MSKKVLIYYNQVNSKEEDIYYNISLSEETHDITIENMCNILINMLNIEEIRDKDLIIGRINAHNNKLFLKELVKYDVEVLQSISYLSNIIKKENNFFNKILNIFKPSFDQPWVFFKAKEYNTLYKIIRKYWFCYGGSWNFFIFDNSKVDSFFIDVGESRVKNDNLSDSITNIEYYLKYCKTIISIYDDYIFVFKTKDIKLIEHIKQSLERIGLNSEVELQRSISQ